MFPQHLREVMGEGMGEDEVCGESKNFDILQRVKNHENRKLDREIPSLPKERIRKV